MTHDNFTCAVDVSRAIKTACADIVSLGRAEIRPEKLLEYCIYLHFGVKFNGSAEYVLGYHLDTGYLNDDEIERYKEDLVMLYQAIEHLLQVLKDDIRIIGDFARPLVSVRVTGLTAYLKF